MPDKLTIDTDQIVKHPGVKSKELKVLLCEYWFVLRLGVWLCLLPIFLRLRSLPMLLQRLTPVRERHKKNSIELDRALHIVIGLCHMRIFYLPIFPKVCLRQSFALYHVLNRMGYPVEIHFGVQKQGEELMGHSWVTIQGKPVADTARREIFKPVYSYRSSSPLDVMSKSGK
jgi:hypothetical protein